MTDKTPRATEGRVGKVETPTGNRAAQRRAARAARKPAPPTFEACCLIHDAEDAVAHSGNKEVFQASCKVVALVEPAMRGGSDAAFCIPCCLADVDALATAIDSMDVTRRAFGSEQVVIDCAEEVVAARAGIKENGKPARKFYNLLDTLGNLHTALHEFVNYVTEIAS
jgi:hypothetical protein